MKKTNIEWTEMTWKITTGCKHNCPYCYCRRFMKDTTPRYHPERHDEPLGLKRPTMIFVANTGDLMGEWVKDWQIKEVKEVAEKCPQHIFQFLTKNPARYADFQPYPKNCWIGTTITCQEDVGRADDIRGIEAGLRFISFEPILGVIREIDLDGIDWAIVGAESIGNAYTPKDEISSKVWAKPLIEKIQAAGLPLFLKPNLRWPERIREMPFGKNDPSRITTAG
ncbi:MAG: DUF5131 family protein [Candidatus Margulisiibacteriota bacterium]